VITPGHRPAGFHPYFLAGVGGYHVTSTGGSGETRLALNGGAGVQFHLGHQSDLFVEGRYLTIRTGQAVNLIPVTFGFRWGGI
jgi:opacity protein-like surface antigen